MKTILVTGGAGFIGSNFIKLALKTNKYRVINLDHLTYAGNLLNLKDIEDHIRYHFIRGSICDRQLVETVSVNYDIDYVINFAAESHVDRSIDEPDVFLKTNVFGTQVLMDVFKNAWQIGKDKDGYPIYKEGVKFLQISTDEVYGTLGKQGKFTELTPIAPNSPYAASKASADLFVRAYHETYKLPVNITRCSNNYGPNQFPEKLIPLMINNTMNEKPLPVYGDGMQVRDWIHVYDHCEAILKVLEIGKIGEVYNIGGNNEKANIEIVKYILYYFDKSDTLIHYVEDRLGHDRRYAIDNTKIRTELGWEPKFQFDEGIHETIAWYTSNATWLKLTANKDYLAYYDKMYADK